MPGNTAVRIRLLDDTEKQYDVKLSSLGNALLQSIMTDLDVLESDYFGASFDEGDGVTFLDPLRPIGKQMKNINRTVLQFGVKFFTPDPSQMQDEYTRYLFALQIKRDINTGILPCAEGAALEIASYIVQAEFGDWNPTECSTVNYLADMKVFPNPTDGQLKKISELHKNLIGKKPAEVDYSLLDVARKLELYGVRQYPALDAQNVAISLGVSHAGVLVFQDSKKISNFNWARIRKLSFKRKRFLVKLRTIKTDDGRPSGLGNVLIFVMNSRDACKNFWRLCVEHHAFFRLEVRPIQKPKPVLLSRGSSFHYNGKTQKELLELVRNSNFRRTDFVRTTSKKRLHNSSISGPTTGELQLDGQSPSSSQSNNTTSGVSAASPSSTLTEDQGSYRIEDSTRSADTSQNVTTADITPDSSQRSTMPEWHWESKSLHSSATPIEGTETVSQEQKEVEGNLGSTSVEHAMQNGKNFSNCDSDSYYPSNSRLRGKKSSQKNDGNVESVETLLQNVTATDRMSIISNTSNNIGLYSGSKSLSFDILRSASCENVVPPLPPKMRQTSNEDGSYDNLKQESVNEKERYSLGDYVSGSGFSGISENTDPFVNDSVVNLAATPVSMTPEVKAKIGEQKIALGHYSVPKRPPTPPDGQFNSPRWDRTSQILDKEINEAMTQLYKAIGDVSGDGRVENGQKICIDGTEPVVVSSSDDEKDEQTESNMTLPPDEDPLLAPIKMDFDDFAKPFLPTT